VDLQLKGKAALVTGSTAGIGFAIASRLAGEGADVIINGRTDERVSNAISEITRKFNDAKVRGIAADLGSAEGCNEVVRQLPRLHILVNNAGIFEPKPFEQISDADWEKFFAVNVMSGVRLSRAYLPEMKKRNWGRVVFISSESALQIPAEMIHTAPLRRRSLPSLVDWRKPAPARRSQLIPFYPARLPVKASRSSLISLPNKTSRRRMNLRRNSSVQRVPLRF
jgi:NAD(P)-dependent dehydrogenase (short-subunit alcohol dehydrogenase family)